MAGSPSPEEIGLGRRSQSSPRSPKRSDAVNDRSDKVRSDGNAICSRISNRIPSGMAAPILTHANRQAGLRLLRRRIRIGRKVGSSCNRRAFRRSVRVREVDIVQARRPRGGKVACLRLRRVRSRGLQQLRGQVLGRRLRPGDSARETCDRQAKAFHHSALNPRPPQALLRIVNQT